jgi:hypothetical protein
MSNSFSQNPGSYLTATYVCDVLKVRTIPWRSAQAVLAQEARLAGSLVSPHRQQIQFVVLLSSSECKC